MMKELVANAVAVQTVADQTQALPELRRRISRTSLPIRLAASNASANTQSRSCVWVVRANFFIGSSSRGDLVDSKIFTVTDQARFAALTGDFNPMHMDPIAARRTPAGAPVVHGIHTLLWLLDNI